MTRETKIGLLVGLAFIIVAGILFSDFMTSTNALVPAPLQMAGGNVRSGLGQPAPDESAAIITTPTNVTPRQTVLTRDELNPRPRIAAPTANHNQDNSSDALVINRPTGISTALRDQANRAGESLIDVQSPSNDTPAAVKPAVAVARTYTVLSGDSLSKIAAKMYGTSTRTSRDAIIAANPSLKENPNRIIVGKSYVIPPLNSAEPVQTTAVLPTAHSPAAKPVAAAQHIYTVEKGDTLWSIAVDEEGNANTVAAIRELNRDVLKGSDRVRPNMKLRLPAKPVE